MEFKMNGHLQLCGTCEYWAGPRQLDYFGGHVVLPQESVEGKCVCLSGPWARGDRRSNNTVCTCYKKWAVLK